MDLGILFAFIHNNVHTIYMPIINKNKICHFSHYTEWNFDFFIYFKQYIVKEYINKHAEVWSHDSIYQQELIVWNKRMFPLAYGYMQFLIVITIPRKVKLRYLMIYETKPKCIFSYKSWNIRKRINLRVIYYKVYKIVINLY